MVLNFIATLAGSVVADGKANAVMVNAGDHLNLETWTVVAIPADASANAAPKAEGLSIRPSPTNPAFGDLGLGGSLGKF